MRPDNWTIRCVECGRFISERKVAKQHFEPDNHFSPEVCEFTCHECIEREQREEAAAKRLKAQYES